MTFKELASNVAKLEGKKSQTSIGNIREILKILSIMVYKNPKVLTLLMRNGKRLSK